MGNKWIENKDKEKDIAKEAKEDVKKPNNGESDKENEEPEAKVFPTDWRKAKSFLQKT